MDLVKRRSTPISGKAGHSLVRAGEEGAEELIQMCEEEAVHSQLADCDEYLMYGQSVNILLSRGVVVGGLVLHERCCAATIEKVDRLSMRATGIGRS